MASGCAPFESIWNRSLFWGTKPPPVYEDPTPYRNWASQIDYPDVTSPPSADAQTAVEPRRLRNLEKEEIWDMSLEQAIQIALSNNQIIRSAGQFLSPANPLLNSPDFVPSSLDPAIQESGVLFGQRGVEAALAEFDTQFTTTAIWGRDEQIQNSQIGTGVTPGSTLTQETGAVSLGLTKRFATGGVVAFIHDWNYQGTNTNDFIPGARLFPSAYTGRVRIETRQPLWAGAGTEYTRIAGPITEQIQGVTGVQQGVVIARINNDIELTEFEGAIRDLLRDVETLYWQLYLSYQTFDMEKSLLADAEASYRKVDALRASESAFAGAVEKAESQTFVIQMQDRVDLARNNLYDAEAQLRRIIGLTVNDGKVIRPLDAPTLAEFVPDWHLTLSEALTRRVELRKQKWNIKRLELQLRAAEHLVKPRLDFVASYQVNGFGDDLLGDERTNNGLVQTNLGNAAATITRGDQTGWNMGFEFSFPFGLRFAHTQVSNLQFQVAKARAALSEQESEVRHELADTFRQLDQTYLSMQRRYNLKLIAGDKIASIEALQPTDPNRYSEGVVLQEREAHVQAQQAYMQSIIEYNIAVMELHYRAGKLLEMNNVHLSEGPWDAEAEADVLDRGYDRWHSLPTKTMLHAEPEAFAHSGPVVSGDPSIEYYGPAFVDPETDEGLPSDDAPPQERAAPPVWDFNEPAFEPVPTESTPNQTSPQYVVPPARMPAYESEPPVRGPQLPASNGDQFLLPVSTARPNSGKRSTSVIQRVSHEQSGASALRSADQISLPAGEVSDADAVWDLGSGEQGRRYRSLTARQAKPDSTPVPRTAGELRDRIQQRAVQARGYPAAGRSRTP